MKTTQNDANTPAPVIDTEKNTVAQIDDAFADQASAERQDAAPGLEYWLSYQVIGSLAAMILLAHCTYISYALPVSPTSEASISH